MLLTEMLVLNSTNQSPANDTDDLNDYSSNDEKWAGNHHYSSNLTLILLIEIISYEYTFDFFLFFKSGAILIQTFSRVMIKS